MINAPVIVVQQCFQVAWLKVVEELIKSHWELRNLIVQITDPSSFDAGFHGQLNRFARDAGLLRPRQVAYTIFPQGLYRDGRDADGVFTAYNREGGMYERLHRRAGDWGTYFRRMTHYPSRGETVNQLGKIITALRDRTNLSKAAYTILIQHPGGETVRPLGGPCLNYLAIQAERGPAKTLGLLAVYRNHDFLKRAYGNYWGLCNLLAFVAREVGATVGPLTCVSSHGYVPDHKVALRRLVEQF